MPHRTITDNSRFRQWMAQAALRKVRKKYSSWIRCINKNNLRTVCEACINHTKICHQASPKVVWTAASQGVQKKQRFNLEMHQEQDKHQSWHRTTSEAGWFIYTKWQRNCRGTKPAFFQSIHKRRHNQHPTYRTRKSSYWSTSNIRGQWDTS